MNSLTKSECRFLAGSGFARGLPSADFDQRGARAERQVPGVAPCSRSGPSRVTRDRPLSGRPMRYRSARRPKGNPPTFTGEAKCTFVARPNSEQDRRQRSRTAHPAKRLHLCSSHDDQAGATQSSTFSPPTRRNSLVLCVTSVALSASAWQAIHRSFAPMGVPASFRRVNCSA